MSGTDTLDQKVNGISSEFADKVGTGEGYVSPPYDVVDVPVVVQETDNGVLVHQQIGTIASLLGEKGTGEHSGDAVKYYTDADFKEEFGSEFVTLQRYQQDFKGIEGIFQTSGASSPVADDAAIMKARLVEIDVDHKAYQQELASELAGQRADIDALKM